jgi:hypothetical protein
MKYGDNTQACVFSSEQTIIIWFPTGGMPWVAHRISTITFALIWVFLRITLPILFSKSHCVVTCDSKASRVCWCGTTIAKITACRSWDKHSERIVTICCYLCLLYCINWRVYNCAVHFERSLKVPCSNQCEIWTSHSPTGFLCSVNS